MMTMQRRRVMMVSWCLAALAASPGCSIFTPDKPFSFESDPALPASTMNALEPLVSVADVLEDDRSGGAEMVRLAADADDLNLQGFLRMQGRHAAHVSHRIMGEGRDLHVVFLLEPGPLYAITNVNVSWPDGYQGPRPPPTNRPPAASASAIQDLREALLRALREQGYPRASTTNQRVLIDHAARSAVPEFTIDPGPPAIFGALSIDGLRKIRSPYVKRLVPWKKGDLYDVRLTEQFEQRFAGGGLFSMIQLKGEPTNAAGKATDDYNLALTVRERRPRTIQLGVGYRTDTGAEASGQWQHRNTFGAGENFTARVRYSEEIADGELRLTVPYFKRIDQRLGFSLAYEEESPDAYDSQSIRASTWLARDVSPDLTLQAGGAIRYLEVEQNDETDRYYLASLPASLVWDRSDNRLDARKGFRVIADTEPFQSLESDRLFFWKNLGTVNGYLPLRRDRSWVAALRITAGSINAASLDDVPADVRFYGGGGESVRGYEYQSLSPRDDEGNLIGGLSLFETSLELRGQWSRTAGMVFFLDGGSAYEEHVPDFQGTFRWGAGVGFRYFTPVGPIRADIGFPLNPRDELDDDFQFYVSIGQSF